MSVELDALVPHYRSAMERWPDAPTLANHYHAVAETFTGSGHGLIETVKSFLECVCLTILGEFGKPMPTADPSTTELLVASLHQLGISSTRGASKLDKVLSAYNRLCDALNECRNEVGPVAHGKDGFLDTLYSNQLRTYLLAGDTLLALILAALEGTEPNLQHTREPYETFTMLHERIDNSAVIQAWVDYESDPPDFVLTFSTPSLTDAIELRVEPSRILYSADRLAFIEVLAASTTQVIEDENAEETSEVETTLPIPTTTIEASLTAFTASYEGNLQHLQLDFYHYLESLSLASDQSLTDPVAQLAPSLLATSEHHMGVDWRERDALQSRMRVALRRVLERFGVSRDDARESAKHIVSWLRIQTEVDVVQATEAIRE